MTLDFSNIHDIVFLIVVILLAFVLGVLIGKGIYEIYILRQENKLDKKRQEIEEKAIQIIKDAERKAQKQLEKVEKMEERLLKKEEKLEKKIEELERQKQILKDKEVQLDALIKQEELKLSEIANLTPEQAKQMLFEKIEKESEEDISRVLSKYRQLLQSQVKEEASMLIAKILPRVSSDLVSEFTVTTIDIPDESIKGRLIGREGRNIQAFERITGVELVIDDTPLIVRLSSYDPEKRFLAEYTLKNLIKDGRINPIYIQKTYEKVKQEKRDIFRKIGEETLNELNLPMMHPDIVEMIGKMKLRYSYGQNLLIHSIEVAKISELIANELGFDGQLAKKAGLLHDIGKLLVESGEAHAKIGADFLRKYNVHPIIIEAAESHHFDIEPTHPISWIVAAADAISASRPGARFNTKDLFIERLSNLEKLILSINGVEKVYIYQAGRQIIVFVNPEQVSDLDLKQMIDKIASKIEGQLDYPGMIRVIVIRESKVSSFLK